MFAYIKLTKNTFTMILDQLFISDKEKQEITFKEDKISEKPIRSILKAISWRIVGTIDTMLISYFITGKITMAITIGSIEVVTKMLLYFFHERVWNFVKWGKQ